MILETVSEVRAHGGTQGVYRHPSLQTNTPMTFSVFVPGHAPGLYAAETKSATGVAA